jgi:tetratricopeptide (TPR) repeat protein
MIAGGIFGIFVGTGVGLISFWRMRTASPPNLQQPDRFWRHFAVSIAVVLLTLILVPALLVLLAMFAPAFNRFQSRMDSAHSGNALRQNAETNFFMGQVWFPQGDSIEIASVERTPEKMVVKGRYNLISHDQALLALYITTSTNIPVPEDASQRMEISNGSGEFELIHPHLVPGLPHVSMYADGHPFASYYFGNADEALEEGKATWISAADKSSLEVAQKGWQLLKAGKLDEAVAKFRQAVQIAPDEANAWNGLGWAEFSSGNAQAAESAFQKTVSLDPNHPGGLNGLGQIYLSQRNYAQAEVYLQKAAPQASAAWYGLARLYLLEGKYGQAEKWAQDLVDAGQADELVHQMLKAAQEKHLSDGLRFRIEPAATSTPGPSPTTNARQPSALQFRLVLPDNSTAPADWLPSASGSNRFRLSRQVLLDDTAIARAGVDFDPSGRRMIEIRFTDTGAHQFEAITATNIGHQLAIVFRGRVLSAPVIQSVIPGGGCQVDASMNAGEVNEIVDRLNRVAIPAPEAWGFSPVEERVLSLKPRPDALFGWLDLDSGTTLASALLDWESRTGYEWIRTNGFDVVTVESAKHFPTLLGFDMVIAPAPTNGWDIVTPADVANNWTLRQAEPQQKQVFSAMPGRTDSFIFQTREGGRGLLQILGFADNPSGVKVRYKLVQASRPSEAIDSATGLQVTPGQTGAIDSATGLPATRPASN